METGVVTVVVVVLGVGTVVVVVPGVGVAVVVVPGVGVAVVVVPGVGVAVVVVPGVGVGAVVVLVACPVVDGMAVVTVVAVQRDDLHSIYNELFHSSKFHKL